MTEKDSNQGEGNRTADREYRERTRDFIENNDVAQAARDAEPDSAAEAAEMERARRETAQRRPGNS